ncbi:MAG: class I adenylate-forming enzyme family protein [Bacillota bacterium]
MNNEKTMIIHKFLKNAVLNFPDKPYLFYEGRQITYRELDAVSDRLACSFLEMGIGRGDKIAIVAPNQPEWLYTYFAAVKIGAAVVALNVRYRLAEFEYMLNNSESKALVCVGEYGGFNFSGFFKENRARFPTVEKYIYIGGGFEGGIAFADLTAGELPDKDRLDRVREKVAESDTAVIIYTSGTTGKPKGAMITNRSILASAMAEVDHFRLAEGDVFIGNLPLNHVGGITCTITTSLIKGGSVVLIPSFRPDLVLEAMEKFRVTVFGGVPTMYVMMLSLPDFNKYDLSAVRICIAGGSNVEPRLCADITRAFPNARLLNLYGLSETSGASVLSRLDDPPEKVGESIGVVIGDFKVRVVGEGGNDLPAGEIGELAFKGDCVAAGYYGLKEETDEAFKDGWVFTGDMGCVDEEGYIYLKGRKKEMYIQGGFNVYPVEIENILTRHPKVLVAAGIGVPDPVFGEVGRFYIIPRPGEVLTEEEIIAYCRQNLADYKVPRQIEFVSELPLTPAGKVHKALLKERCLNQKVN